MEDAMAIRSSDAEWKGNLRNGQGTMKLGSGAFEGAYSFPSRFEAGKGTNPEELIAAAHAGCYSMALSAGLSAAGFTATRIHTTARVHLEPVGQGFAITKIELQTEAEIPGIRFSSAGGGGQKELPGLQGSRGTPDHLGRDPGETIRRCVQDGVGRLKVKTGAAVPSPQGPHRV
jgi:lipoyl-dependent peroxiredoxin